MRHRLNLRGVLVLVQAAVTLTCAAFAGPAAAEVRWVVGDLHTHTNLTDGSHVQEDVLSHAFNTFGCDWMANSEHGGAYNRSPEGTPWSDLSPQPLFLGNPAVGSMWRWQSLLEYSYPIIAEARPRYAGKQIIQGYEWNVPSHEHASVAVVGDGELEGLSVAQHEYLFDASDSGTTSDGYLSVSGKSTVNKHPKAVAGAAWLQSNFPYTSYFILNHPSRKLLYSIAHIRDFNNAAPTVCFGLEGVPGHQKEGARGGYGDGPYTDAGKNDITFKARTFGGADYMIAKVGGLWDALLGEGRRFWTFANSDFHSSADNADFYPGEYAKNYNLVANRTRDHKWYATDVVNSLRSGNGFSVTGDLINALDFRVEEPRRPFMPCLGATMGETLNVRKNSQVYVTIRFKSPRTNNNGGSVQVDHIDLIQGNVTGYTTPGTPEYSKDTNDSTRVVARFNKSQWKKTSDGWNQIEFPISHIKNDFYVRLRGTNVGVNVANETDADGNPLNDDLMGTNDLTKAYADTWFYSNPIFVHVTK